MCWISLFVPIWPDTVDNGDKMHLCIWLIETQLIEIDLIRNHKKIRNNTEID